VTGLAHGGGAPEAALIGLPLVLFTVFLLLERRARRSESRPDTTHHSAKSEQPRRSGD
jgi:hypothetical protein